MTLVVDASVAVKFVVRETGSEAAKKLLKVPDPLIAPDWLLAEAASTLWKKVKRSELLIIHAERCLDDLPRFFERLVPARALLSEAFGWSFRLRHSIYDCFYLALALQEESRLVTADVKFHGVLDQAGLGEVVMLLGEEDA